MRRSANGVRRRVVIPHVQQRANCPDARPVTVPSFKDADAVLAPENDDEVVDFCASKKIDAPLDHGRPPPVRTFTFESLVRCHLHDSSSDLVLTHATSNSVEFVVIPIKYP
jgi:hypothetical protein